MSKFTKLLAASAVALMCASASAQVFYSSIPAALPGNVSSLGYEATSTKEFGDRIRFATGSDSTTSLVAVNSVTVVMSSWGCENGDWNHSNCTTTPGATFSHPITLNIYADSGSGIPGQLLATVTKTFDIPYRPSASPEICADGKWGQVSHGSVSCFNGLATKITFDLQKVRLPQTVVWGIAYNTSHYGSPPMGSGTVCYNTSGGCGYDSLNVGAQSFNPIVGVDVDPNGAFWNTSYGPFYCDGGVGGVGIFRLDDSASSCWTGYRPMVEFASVRR